MFTGSCVALVTPMRSDGSIDLASLRGLVDWHLSAGTQAIVVVGTTGECPTLTEEEITQVIQEVVKGVAGKIPVIAGTGTNCTRTTIEETLHAKGLGCDAALIIAPYYNRPTQTGLLQHFTAVHDAVDFPIILYNQPFRTGCDLQPATVAALSKLTNIVGLKEASGDLKRVPVLREICKKGFRLYTGDDDIVMPFMQLGGEGNISVVANILPKEMQSLCQALLAGDFETALVLNKKCEILFKNLFVESNPIPVKWALHAMGRIPEGIRLPLTRLSSSYETQVREALKQAGALHA